MKIKINENYTCASTRHFILIKNGNKTVKCDSVNVKRYENGTFDDKNCNVKSDASQ